ncbi:carboxylate--amine ligase [Helcococcus massiliensis]|uniref:carboxylate--amine ligase n=1 Tax=Helcococcus massiliensis TaxID=2040290 RepID=UPI000CDE5AF2|nr:carboxylate--amine ligase [Helcococcus massiliensis]
MYFLPVILGSDWNVYGVASAIHMAYGVKSIAFAIHKQIYTEHLDYLTVYPKDGFDTKEVFVNVLLDFAKSKETANKKLLLISCSDYYTKLICEFEDILSEYYLFNYVDNNLRIKLENKKDFYQVADKYGLAYPNTLIINKENHKDYKLKFDFPIICKPNDSVEYVKIHFPGYKKAYTIEDKEELDRILHLIYENGYTGEMILQDFIPGGVENMYVVNAYVDKNHNVLMTHGARTALDECEPRNIGNYNALISGDYSELTANVKKFLEDINYTGFANFDFKYDPRDKKYKVFEINIRQGRSSMYMIYAGNNFIKYLVEDMIYNNSNEYYDHKKPHLWYLTAKSVLLKYTPAELKDYVKELLADNKTSSYGFDYYKYKNINRFIVALRRKLSTIRYYKKYMG